MHDYRLDFMHRGMTIALKNFKRKQPGATTSFSEDVEIELVEVLMWVAAVNERLWEINRNNYRQLRDTSQAGRIVDALRFVRNAYVHSGPEAISMVGGGMTVPIRFPIRFQSPGLKWKPWDHLGNTGKPDANAQARYREVLEGQDVLKTLEDAHNRLSSELV